MKSISFPQANCELAKDQKEYQTLHTHVVTQPMRVEQQDGSSIIQDRPVQYTACFELSEDEINEIIATKKLWYTQHTGGNLFQPINMSTKNPFQ